MRVDLRPDGRRSGGNVDESDLLFRCSHVRVGVRAFVVVVIIRIIIWETIDD
jgi:hypothetical protein